MNLENVKPSESYEGLKTQFFALKKMFNNIHKELDKILHPFDPFGFYVLVPTILIMLYLFT